jgi:hypothetical protein
MPTLFDFLNNSNDAAPNALRECRLGGEPATVLLFTAEIEQVALHWEKDPMFRCFIQCPGDRCPICYLGAASEAYALLPVLNFESGEVEVLRIPARRGPGSLGARILPLIQDPSIATKVVSISRTDSRYSVSSRPLGEHTNHGEPAIEQFVQARESGLKLSSAFPCPTAGELAEAPRIRCKLDVIGGYEPQVNHQK